MTRVSVLADCLTTILNAEKRGKRQVLIRPSYVLVVCVCACSRLTRTAQFEGHCPLLVCDAEAR